MRWSFLLALAAHAQSPASDLFGRNLLKDPGAEATEAAEDVREPEEAVAERPKFARRRAAELLARYFGDSTRYGADINYYLKAQASGPVVLEILQQDGRLMAADAPPSPLAPKAPHFPGRAKRVVPNRSQAAAIRATSQRSVPMP